ncbi:MAG TPA: UDP-N-acetylglucosamine 2-epimerase (non-hydrolyzing) [Allosphingosinicella sp.]|jgi:UDP-N-acetylglucosamine 2-epimerase
MADAGSIDTACVRLDQRSPPAPGLIASIVGTRPEAIKMAPVVRALAARGFKQRLLLTGQHDGLRRYFDDSAAIVDLEVDRRGQSFEAMRDAIRTAVCGELVPRPPDFLLVQGDTTSALAGALAAKACGVPLGHVEAGLRSFDLDQPWPEEGNRIAIDRLSDLLFAPTAVAARNLDSDPAIQARIYITGNTGIDALFAARAELGPVQPAGSRNTLLVTCHRKENQGEAMVRICHALKRLVDELPVDILLPLHLNPHVRAAAESELAGQPHIRLVEPVEHLEMVRLMLSSWAILTDSGGLQEEGPALGRPVLVLREVTERPEAAANIVLVGTSPGRIVEAVSSLLAEPERYARMATPAFPYGDGHAAWRIADAIGAFLLARTIPLGDGPCHGAGLERRQLA